MLYHHRGEIDPGDGALEIEVDGRVVLLDGAGDGESLVVRDEAWEDPFAEPLSEENREYVATHGKWQRMDVSHEDGYADLVGQVIREVRLLKHQHGHIAGVRLSESARSLWFVVESDECDVHCAHPIRVIELKR